MQQILTELYSTIAVWREGSVYTYGERAVEFTDSERATFNHENHIKPSDQSGTTGQTLATTLHIAQLIWYRCFRSLLVRR